MEIKQNTILWDFDGVLIDSNQVRTDAFKHIFKEFSPYKVDQIINFHLENGGLSRYYKINYFFKEIERSEIDDISFKKYLSEFKAYVVKEITTNNLLIEETINFIKKNLKSNIIISASDQEELRFLCNHLNISHLFKGIYGSPKAKKDNINSVLKDFNISKLDVVYIGDSINDYDAATENQISFLGYNNEYFKEISIDLIKNFKI